jgi:hypothetical protein
MQDNAQAKLLDRVHKLLAQAEDESVTPEEAQAFTAKAAELMAKYGIDRALLADTKPETDKPSSKVLDFANPWARVKAHLLCGLASSLRCQAILLGRSQQREGAVRIHLFGYQSDIERAEMLYASVLIQMWHGLAGAEVPGWCRSPRAWRRSWMLGFATAVITRVRAAETAATQQSDRERSGDGSRSTAMVLADRSQVIRSEAEKAYPMTRSTRITYSGSGYRGGHDAGQRADIGGTRVGGRSHAAIG